MLHKFVAVYVPGTLDGNTPLADSVRIETVRKIARALSEKFGGATCTDGTGYWLSSSGYIVEERVTIVKSFYADDVSNDALDFTRALALDLKNGLLQEAVTIETESGIDFV